MDDTTRSGRLASPRTASKPAEQLRQALVHNQELFAELRDHPELLQRLRALEAFQTQRLKETHSDLGASRRYAAGIDFFINDLYAPKDFSARDADIEAAYPYMVRLLPERVLNTAAQAMELYVLTQDLDRAMTHALFDDLAVQAIDHDSYAEAYRACDDYRRRAHQIELVRLLARKLDEYVRHRFILTTLRMARGPALMIGLGDLQDFLERGFSAFRHMRGSSAFVRTIARRETGILDRIFARDPEPFRLRGNELTIEE